MKSENIQFKKYHSILMFQLASTTFSSGKNGSFSFFLNKIINIPMRLHEQKYSSMHNIKKKKQLKVSNKLIHANFAATGSGCHSKHSDKGMYKQNNIFRKYNL